MQIQCIKCKGRGFCGRISCPHITKSKAQFKVKELISSEEFSGRSPAVFVGRVGYPNLNVGVLSPPSQLENTWEHDAPRHWGQENYKIDDVINLRSNLINSRFKVGVKEKSKFLEIGQEIAMASKPVDIEIDVEKKPQFSLDLHSVSMPMGPNATLEKIQITSNPKISSKVERVVSDTDLKSMKALRYLFKKGFDENFLSKILSIGNIGVKKDRKLVPTRWSITAVDDNIGKEIIDEIKNYNSIDYRAYFGSYLGNYYLVLMFPEVWGYELFEMYMPNVSWNVSDKVEYTTDHEFYDGRKTYAHNTAGGYYAARMPILQKLKSMKKQSSVVVVRIITGEYYCPLGVWVVREAAKKAMNSKGISFDSQELMLKYAKALVRKKFGYDLNDLLNESVLLRNMKQQKKLSRFF